jgi:class 3 adenylate cyclase
MAAVVMGRSGRHISIGVKIFTVAFVVFALMSSVTLLTVYMAATVSRELDALGHRYIEAYVAVARTHIWSLERSLAIRRLYIAIRDGDEPATIRALQQSAEAAGTTAQTYIATARRIVRDELATGSGIANPATLSRIETLLQVLDEERANLSQHQDALIAALGAGQDPTTLRRRLDELDSERDRFDRRLETTRSEMRDALGAASDATRAQQDYVVKAVLVITGLAGMLGLIFAGAFSRGMSLPVRRLVAGTKAVQAGNLDTVVGVTSRDEIGILTEAFNAMIAELRVTSRVKDTFGKYIDPRIVQGLVEHPELTGTQGERRVMTVLFCDMKGFTALSEGMTPAGLVTILNHYLTVMSAPIRRHDGIIDKYIGDALMAFWGPPFVAAEAQAGLACLAALEQIAELPGLATTLPQLIGLKHGLPDVSMRIGIATGEVIVGNIGSDVTKSYTVIGDTVNLASRLESANKLYGTLTLIGEATALLAVDTVELREIDSVLVVGSKAPQRIFEIMGRKNGLAAERLALRDHFGRGLAAYRRRDWDAARAAFRECLAVDPTDGPTRIFLSRLDQLAMEQPGAEWDGIWVLASK